MNNLHDSKTKVQVRQGNEPHKSRAATTPEIFGKVGLLCQKRAESRRHSKAKHTDAHFGSTAGNYNSADNFTHGANVYNPVKK